MASGTQQRAGRAATSKAVARRAPAKAPVKATPDVAADDLDVDVDYSLEAVVQQRRDALGHDGDMVTFSQGGKVFEMPHPLFATDEWKEGLSDVRGDVEFGKYVLGDQYDEFRACGGQSSHIALLIDQIRQDAQEVDGKGRPTQSSTLSRVQRRQQRRR
jgi:hypothetical protein